MRLRPTPHPALPERRPYFRLQLDPFGVPPIVVDGQEITTLILIRQPTIEQRKRIQPFREGTLQEVIRLLEHSGAWGSFDSVAPTLEACHALIAAMWADPVLEAPSCLDDWFEGLLSEVDILWLGYAAALAWLSPYGTVPAGLQERVDFTPGDGGAPSSSPSISPANGAHEGRTAGLTPTG